MLEIRESQEGEVCVIEVSGRIDSATAGDLDRSCDQRIVGGARRILLDLSGIDYVSSAGLRVFLVVAKKLQKQGGRLALCNLAPVVREILAISGFDRILTTAASRGEGLAKLL